MAVIDCIALLLVGLSVLHGLWRGFTQQALGVGSWILAIFLACHFVSTAAQWVRTFIHNPLLADIVAFVGLFLALVVICSLLVSTIVKTVKSTALSGIDSTLGGVFGLVRGLLAVLLLFMVAQWFLPTEDMQSLEENGRLTPYIQQGVTAIQPFLPTFSAKRLALTGITGHDPTL